MPAPPATATARSRRKAHIIEEREDREVPHRGGAPLSKWNKHQRVLVGFTGIMIRIQLSKQRWSLHGVSGNRKDLVPWGDLELKTARARRHSRGHSSPRGSNAQTSSSLSKMRAKSCYIMAKHHTIMGYSW